MNLQPTFLIGKVTEINPTGYAKNSIRFKVPGVWENMTKYPVALPVNSHSAPTKVNDTVFVTKLYSDLDEFVYQPFDLSEFIGLRNDKSTVELKDNKIESESEVIEINATKKLLVKYNGDPVFSIENGQFDFLWDINSLNPVLSKMFTCSNCFMTGAEHGTNSFKKVGV